MSLLCLFGKHKYQRPVGKCYMKCERCGEILRGFHEFNGGCKCVRCGALDPGGRHTYELIAGSCRRQCTVCGKIDYLSHIWKDCKCERCGTAKKTGHEYVYIGKTPIYGRCPTLDLSDQYVCNFCDKKDCHHVVLRYEYRYRCGKCGNSISVGDKTHYKVVENHGKLSCAGNEYRIEDR